MSTVHRGNMLNEITFEEHDGTLNAKKVTVVGSTATIFAVVNTAAAGQSSVVLDTGTKFIGIVTVANPSSFTGNLTLDAGSRTGILGNLTLSDSKGFIGLTTSVIGSPLPAGANFIGLVTVVGSLSPAAGNVTLDPGSKTQIAGNITLSDSKTFIGLTTTIIGSSPSVQAFGQFFAAPQSIASGGLGPILLDNFGRQVVSQVGTVTIQDGGNSITIDGSVGILGNVTLSDPKGFIGLATVINASSPAFIGIVTIANKDRTLTGNVTITDSKTYIGLTTTTLGASLAFIGIVTITNKDRTITGNVTLSDAKTYLGLTTTTLGVGDRFIGLVTAVSQNAGTNKTIFSLPITLSTSSIATIVVPATNQRIFITNMILSSDATVRMSLKSGVTYLTGNASLGISLNPGGGFIQTGAPDSPSWIGLPSGALVVEKFDMTATKASVGGTINYFTES